VRGPQGGHALIRDPRDLRLSEAISALEGSLAPIACLEDPNGCRGTASCTLRPVWSEIEAATVRILEGITIADLAERERASSVARYTI
jgi:Rrf2 family protein